MPKDVGRANPKIWAAGLVGLLGPGFGQIYLGQYRRAFLLAVVSMTLVALCLSLLGAGPGLVLGLYVCAALFGPLAALWAAADAIRTKNVARHRTPLWAYLAFFLFMLAISLTMAVGFLRVGTHRIFSIPNMAMAPAILANDVIVVRKLKTPEDRTSLKPGDVIVFQRTNTQGARREYVKRVIGLAGQTIEMNNDIVLVDGRPFEQTPDGTFKVPFYATGDIVDARMSIENTFDGKLYKVLSVLEYGPLDNRAARLISAGHYFVMGDNRDQSEDSRMPQFGDVPTEDVIGVAEYVVVARDSRRIGERLDR